MTEKIQFQITRAMLGKEVTLVGQALWSKAGPGIFLQDEIFIFIEGIDDWSEELQENQVVVKGVLLEEKVIPDVVIDTNGAISQGALGKQLILRKIISVKEYQPE